jgi:mRNA interferase YafQ
MYTVKPTTKFQKDLRRAEKRGYNLDLLAVVIKTLAMGESLDARYNDHPLKGLYKGCRECHITPDWLLIYEVVNTELILYLTRTGMMGCLFPTHHFIILSLRARPASPHTTVVLHKDCGSSPQ